MNLSTKQKETHRLRKQSYGGRWEENGYLLYVRLSSFAVHLKRPQHCKLTIPQYKILWLSW